VNSSVRFSFFAFLLCVLQYNIDNCKDAFVLSFN